MSDLISRQAAIDECYPVTVDGEVYEVVQVETLMGLPSAQPERKNGKWIRDEYGELYCSECGRYTEDRHDMMSEFEGMKCIALVPPNYCGYCGAKMKEG